MSNSNGDSAYANAKTNATKMSACCVHTTDRQHCPTEIFPVRRSHNEENSLIRRWRSCVFGFGYFMCVVRKTALTYSDTFCGLLMRTDTSSNTHARTERERDQRQNSRRANDRLFGVIIMRSPHCERQQENRKHTLATHCIWRRTEKRLRMSEFTIEFIIRRFFVGCRKVCLRTRSSLHAN